MSRQSIIAIEPTAALQLCINSEAERRAAGNEYCRHNLRVYFPLTMVPAGFDHFTLSTTFDDDVLRVTIRPDQHHWGPRRVGSHAVTPSPDSPTMVYLQKGFAIQAINPFLREFKKRALRHADSWWLYGCSIERADTFLIIEDRP